MTSDAQLAANKSMQNPETEKHQQSVDHAKFHSIFHRCLAALRKIQTEHGVRSQAFPESGPAEGICPL